MGCGFWEKIVRKNPDGFSCLAPMEGATDASFRQVVRHAACPDVFWTEFTNVSSFANVKGRPNATLRLKHKRNEQPIVAQIWGRRPDEFGFIASRLGKLGFGAVDINMGCPDKNVVKTGGGSALICNSDLACEIIRATKTGGLPVSVKTRLGFASVDEWRDWLTLLMEQNIAALTVHLRTRKEMSKVPAHYEVLSEIIRLRDEIAPSMVLIVNGDIRDYQHGREILQKYPGVNGFMIGRGVFENPFCFEKELRQHTTKESLGLLELHLKLFDKAGKWQKISFEPLKHFFKIYVRDFAGASELRAKLMECHSTEEARKTLAAFRDLR